jgi:hypothetical protein
MKKEKQGKGGGTFLQMKAVGAEKLWKHLVM